MDDSQGRYVATIDSVEHRLIVANPSDSARKLTLTYHLTGELLSIDGPLGGDTLHVRLTRIDPPSFPVLRPGFHWLSD
jgi:hypothetical protein